MKRILPDTNIYGLILEKDEPEKFKELVNKANIVIYGIKAVRKELRDAPKRSTIFNRSIKAVRNLRISLLALYDSIIKKEYPVSERMKRIAYDYYTAYKEFDGKSRWTEIENDFIVVACASIHNLDIVVSEDRRTMLSDEAIRAYRIINKINSLRMPQFIGYADFRRLLA